MTDWEGCRSFGARVIAHSSCPSAELRRFVRRHQFNQVSLRVSEPQGDDAAAQTARLARRNDIANVLVQEGFTLAAKPPSEEPVVSVWCKDETKEWLQALFPDTTVASKVQTHCRAGQPRRSRRDVSSTVSRGN